MAERYSFRRFARDEQMNNFQVRVGRTADVEIDKHFSDGFSTLLIRQKVWNGHVQSFLKTENGARDIDLHP